MLARTALSFFLTTTLLSLTSCKDPVALEEPITQAQTLGGQSISAATLSNGRQMYVRHCRACHGFKGDGRGPSSPGLRPAPRDLRLATYKFTRMEDGTELPTDAALTEIVSQGLHGTAMLPWGDIQEDALSDIIHYIKTFSPPDEGWRDPDKEVVAPIAISEDPWKGKDEDAIKLGRKVFHGKAKCQSCHPAYVTKKKQWEFLTAYADDPRDALRDDMYQPIKQESAVYMVEDKAQWQKPPDYTWDPVRTLSGSTDTKRDLYRVIGAGVNGTAMTGWKGTALKEDELWAVAYYVDSLVAKRGTPAAKKLRDRLNNQESWAPPAPAPEVPEEAEAEAVKADG